MNNDLLERISSYLNGEEDEGDRRNAEVAYWLYRSCTPGTPEYNRAELLSSKHKLISRESIIAEDYALEHHLWFEDDGILGMVGPSGDENNCYFSPDGLTIYKVNILTHSGDRILPVFEKVLVHNSIFPETRYDFVGFTNMGIARSAYPIFKQRMITGAINAMPEEIADFMKALGFHEDKDCRKPAAWSNGTYTVWDLQPKNVLKDKQDNIFVIDAEIMIR